MSEALLPSAKLRALLDAKLDTLEKLEITLALRDAPARTASIDALARQLQVGSGVLSQVVDEIARAGVVVVNEQAVTLVLDGAHGPVLDEAAVLYKQNRNGMARVFTTIAMDRIRRAGARTFADAFQFRRRKGDDNG